MLRGSGQRRRRGSTLGATLVFISVAAVISSLLVGACFFGVTVSHQLESSIHARQMADSIVAATIEHMMAAQAGAQNYLTPYTFNAAISTDGYASSGVMTFTNGSQNGWPLQVPMSTNNLLTSTATKGSLMWVPPFCVDVVGEGTCGGILARDEAMVYIPPYPFAIATAGSINSQSGLLVEGVHDTKNLQQDITQIPASAILPADVESNSPLASWAVQTLPSTWVSGDVNACGGISIPPSSVGGATMAFTGPGDIPRLDVTQFKPDPKKVLNNLGSSQVGSKTLEGYSEADKGYEVFGDLTLDASVLYVVGDLKIHGALTGEGAVFVTGATTIEAGEQNCNFSTNNILSLASVGDITLTANGRANNDFRGIIYTEGNFNASKITLFGAFIGQTNPNNQPNQMNLTDVGVLHVPDYTHTTMQVKLPPPPYAGGVFAGYTAPTVGVTLAVSYDPNYGYAEYWQGPPTNQWMVVFYDCNPPDVPPPPQYANLQFIPLACYKANNNYVVPQFSSLTDPNVPPYPLDTPYNTILTMVNNFLATLIANPQATANSNSQGGVGKPFDPTQWSTPPVQSMVNQTLSDIVDYTKNPKDDTWLNSQTETWSIDLNQFLGVSDQMKLLIWRDY
jgi:hypothetical protein